MSRGNGHHREAVIDIGKPVNNFTGGLEFSNLSYTVIKKSKVEDTWVKQEVDLLSRITGYAAKGCVTGVMGPSGAGKSTFLDGLAGRISSGSLRGRVTLDGKETSPSLIKRTSAYIMQDDRLFPMLTVYETLLFAADFRLGDMSKYEKMERVHELIEKLGLSSSTNTYIGDEGTRGVSGGERRRVSIGVDIIHGPPLLFLDEPTSGLDSTSAHSVIEKMHDIAHAGSTVILTIHQPSSRIQLLLDNLIILARGQLMYQGPPREVAAHLGRLGRKVPKGENSIECLIDMIQEYDQSEHGVDPLAEFALTGLKPPALDDDMSISSVPPTPTPPCQTKANRGHNQQNNYSHKRLPLKTGSTHVANDFDCSVRSVMSPGPRSWTPTYNVLGETFKFTPTHPKMDQKKQQHQQSISYSPGYYIPSSEILKVSSTPHSSEYTVTPGDYASPDMTMEMMNSHYNLGPKFANSFFTETWILMRRNFVNIYRTPELFLSRLMVLTVMGFMIATMFIKPKANLQGITDRLSFFIFTVCLFFFSSNDAVPAFIQERFIFVRETSHNAYRASSYTIAGLITYLPFLLLQAGIYALIVWWALELRGSFLYFLIVLYVSLLSTNSFVVFVSSIVPNYILGYAAVIAFTALFFLFCGYFLSSHDIPKYWSWMHAISTMTYPYEGLLMNQFQTTQVFGVNPAGFNVTGNVILEGLHIELKEKAKWMKVVIMLGWAVLYRVLFYIVLRFFSKNQRS